MKLCRKPTITPGMNKEEQKLKHRYGNMKWGSSVRQDSCQIKKILSLKRLQAQRYNKHIKKRKGNKTSQVNWLPAQVVDQLISETLHSSVQHMHEPWVSCQFLAVHTKELLLEDEYPTSGTGLYVSWAVQLPLQALESKFDHIRFKGYR